jgi:hypothetical protein
MYSTGEGSSKERKTLVKSSKVETILADLRKTKENLCGWYT